METLVRTPQLIFMQPQRLVVPLFQRPYVWNQEKQWEPLWEDIVRVAERRLKSPSAKHSSHFLGAVVLQQAQSATGHMQERTIIDGQQRLTTLQLLLDALHAELMRAGANLPAQRIEPLVANGVAYGDRPEDRFKVWPTNRDRGAFYDVMGAPPPVDHEKLRHKGERMVEAHRFFSEQARSWLADGDEDAANRAEAIEFSVREQLQMVVIDLGADENSQEIFETLNARGAQLTAADLIKNFIFHRLQEAGANTEEAHRKNWEEFESGFWEAEVNVGRAKYARSSVFLNHWLVSRTGDDIVAREVFERFKRYANDLVDINMLTMLEQVARASKQYREFVEFAGVSNGPLNRLSLFGYRTGVLESEVVKPLVLVLLDPESVPVPHGQFTKALDVVESWMVRRMLVRATTKGYNRLLADLIAQLRREDRAVVGDYIESFFLKQSAASSYWPDDEEVRGELRSLLAYRRLGRGRLRMVLEALEDHLRGWRGGQEGLGGERVTRGKFAIEHVMPRKWAANWPALEGFRGEAERDQLVHTLGNLTLLSGRLNAKVSNGPWLGLGGKREGLRQHDVLFLNKLLLDSSLEAWTDAAIRSRTEALASLILEIWPAPPGHRSGFAEKPKSRRRKVALADLLNAGFLQPGMSLFPRRKQHAGVSIVLLPDGRIDVDGAIFPGPSDAASAIRGKRVGGWWWLLVDRDTRRTLRDVRRDYMETLATDLDELGDEDDEEDDDDQ